MPFDPELLAQLREWTYEYNELAGVFVPEDECALICYAAGLIVSPTRLETHPYINKTPTLIIDLLVTSGADFMHMLFFAEPLSNLKTAVNNMSSVVEGIYHGDIFVNAALYLERYRKIIVGYNAEVAIADLHVKLMLALASGMIDSD